MCLLKPPPGMQEDGRGKEGYTTMRCCPVLCKLLIFLCFVGPSVLLLVGLWRHHGTTESFYHFPQRKPSPETLHFQADCRCQSLFSIDSCDDGWINQEVNNSAISKALNHLKLARRGGPQSIHETLHELTRFLPSTFSLDDNNHIDTVRRVNKKISYIPCNVHAYSKADIETCLSRRFDVTKKPLHIAFVGDSFVRNLMEQIVVMIRDHLKLTMTARNGTISDVVNFLGHRVKDDCIVTGDGIILDYYWCGAFFMPDHNRPWDRLERTMLDRVPDLIFFDIGNWPLLYDLEIDVIAEVELELNKTRDMFKKLSRSSTVLMRSPTPTKRWVRLDDNVVPDPALEEIGKLGWHEFKGSGVWVWDTITPVYLKENDECRVFWKVGPTKKIPLKWFCWDRIHFSQAADAVASNQIWNLMCNKVMRMSPKHCCA